MTRIFDALRKARPALPAGAPAGPPAYAAIAAVPPVPWKAVRPAAERPPAPDDGFRRQVVPLGAAAELSPEVQREMTGLRVSLEVALTGGIPRTVMFLASQGGEGTSTVAAQFARMLAGDERLRVLLVDAHARRPAYELDGTPVAARPERPAPTPPASSGERSPDLMPLPQGARDERLLSAASLRGSLEPLASSYDWIVIDGPPVLESPDAATLGPVADGVIVVVQAGRTKRPVLTRSVDLLSRAGGRMLGVVLNRRRLEIPEFIYRRI